MSLLIRWKIIKYIKTGNKQRSIYWNPIKRGGNKMNKRERERERDFETISSSFCTCLTWIERVVCPQLLFLSLPPFFPFASPFHARLPRLSFLFSIVFPLSLFLSRNVYQVESNFPPIRTLSICTICGVRSIL